MMEAAAATSSSSSLLLFSCPTPRRSPSSSFPSPSLLRPPCNSSFPSNAKQPHLICLAVAVLPRPTPNCNCKKGWSGFRFRSTTILRCSARATGGPSERWLLEPAGDGDWRHIGYKVARPGAFQIVSDAVTVGRVADKADIVLPIATVSGAHARLEKKDGDLLVTDLDSTNGTYVNERRLTPGFAMPIDPGSLLIFGDIHLAMFRVRKMIVEETGAAEQEETNTEVVSAVPEDASTS